MIPDLHWTTIPLGPIVIQVWGLFVALGIIVAIGIAKQFAEARKLDGQLVVDAAFWIILAAMIGSRLWYVITEWSQFSGHWVDTFKIWQGGMSISGGFVGAVIAGVWYFHRRQVSFWQYADILVYALPLGMAIGRLGCFFIFDHPGTPTDFFLGEVYYVDGIVRHNHGLYLALNGLVMWLVFLYVRFKWKAQPPYFVTIFLIWYGASRIWLDTYRINDSEWYSLTAAQWLGIVMVVAGLVIFGTRQIIRKKYK